MDIRIISPVKGGAVEAVSVKISASQGADMRRALSGHNRDILQRIRRGYSGDSRRGILLCPYRENGKGLFD